MLYIMEESGSQGWRYAVSDEGFQGYSRSICPHCGREIAAAVFGEGPHRMHVEGGRRWPDLLPFCGAGTTTAGGRLTLLSHRAVDIFSQEGIRGIAGYQKVDVICPDGPEYFLADISGRVDLDLAAMSNLRKKNLCPACGQFQWSRQKLGPFVLDPKTWDGSDLCLLTSLPGYVICTEKVKNITEKYRLSNFLFSEIPSG